MVQHNSNALKEEPSKIILFIAPTVNIFGKEYIHVYQTEINIRFLLLLTVDSLLVAILRKVMKTLLWMFLISSLAFSGRLATVSES